MRSFVLVLAAAAAAITVSATTVAAESGARDGLSHGSGNSSSTRTTIPGATAADHIDPYGFHHADSGPMARNQHRENLREYHRQRNADLTDNASVRGARSDDGGRTLCRPHANWC
ncbi:hypothetical protein [Nocardia transvalensis]|uniref:hypothetical protein n=1 Tax=Nocardia transvalensis TaxID=37333 RepID=UPI0018957BD6|nr:hypothetical protein [Nocardia transvalensis]MBF6334136.1 hypothetical protein [Nocardia transvalensis]